jgi:hypothetical protein
VGGEACSGTVLGTVLAGCTAESSRAESGAWWWHCCSTVARNQWRGASLVAPQAVRVLVTSQLLSPRYQHAQLCQPLLR